MEKGLEKAVLDLSLIKKGQEKVALQSNTFRKENSQRQIENCRLSYHPLEH